MPTYDGYLITRDDSDHVGGYYNSEMLITKSCMTVDKPYTGTHSLVLGSGGTHNIYYGCAAGNTTITVWCWPPAGNGVGKCSLEVLEVGGETLFGIDSSSGVGAWEQLSVAFVALKKVYRVRLTNGVGPSGDNRCYFDDLV